MFFKKLRLRSSVSGGLVIPPGMVAVCNFAESRFKSSRTGFKSFVKCAVGGSIKNGCLNSFGHNKNLEFLDVAEGDIVSVPGEKNIFSVKMIDSGRKGDGFKAWFSN